MELLETVALTPATRFYNRFAYELSGGQRQRVVIARALAVEPELIIADEPISSLDVSIRAEVLELLNKLVHERDVGILYITHDLLSARMLSDEVIVLNGGQGRRAGPVSGGDSQPQGRLHPAAPRRDPQPVRRRGPLSPPDFLPRVGPELRDTPGRGDAMKERGLRSSWTPE